MSARPRWQAAVRLGTFAIVLGVVASLAGCRDRKEEARQKAELTASLEQYKTQVADLQRQTAALRARFDGLPADLPGADSVRDDLHTLEEVVGVEDGRTKWLSLELDKAFASGSKAEIEKVRTAIPRNTVGIGQIGVKVMHELLPLEGLASQRRFFQEVDAVNAQRQQPPQAKRP